MTKFGRNRPDPLSVFQPDGKTLATARYGGGARLWDVATGQQIGPPLAGPAEVLSVAFSPDGKTLATTSRDGGARLWDVGYLVSPLAQLCSRLRGALTRIEWARYVPPGPAYRKICP